MLPNNKQMKNNLFSIFKKKFNNNINASLKNKKTWQISVNKFAYIRNRAN